MKQSTQIIWWIMRLVLGLLMLLGAVTHATNTKEGVMAESVFITALVNTGYLWQIIGITELLTGLAILAGRFVPLALVLLAPITLNILLFHISHPSPDGIGIALAIIIPHIGLAWLYRKHYSSLLKPNSSLINAPESPAINPRSR